MNSAWLGFWWLDLDLFYVPMYWTYVSLAGMCCPVWDWLSPWDGSLVLCTQHRVTDKHQTNPLTPASLNCQLFCSQYFIDSSSVLEMEAKASDWEDRKGHLLLDLSSSSSGRVGRDLHPAMTATHPHILWGPWWYFYFVIWTDPPFYSHSTSPQEFIVSSKICSCLQKGMPWSPANLGFNVSSAIYGFASVSVSLSAICSGPQ